MTNAFLDHEGYGPLRPPSEDYRFEYEEGRQAFVEGRPADSNDYPKRSASHSAWNRGWQDANRARNG